MTAPTERLYYTDAYLRRFDARVTGRDDGGRRVYLDRSAFYPTSGGQPHDLGTLGGVPVADVVDDGERVAHVLATPLPDGDTARGEVDWERRFDFMQQHTGQHLISAIFADVFGYATVSVHFGDAMSTLDLDTPTVDAERLREAEARANAVIFDDREVTVSFEDASAAAGLRKATERGGTIRVVTIDGTDRSACGGTHVRRTGEIGVLLLRRQEKVRKSTRIEFVCGGRAARRARQDFESLSAMAQSMSASFDEVPGLVATMQRQWKDGEGERRRLEGELAEFRARESYEQTRPDAGGVRRFVRLLDRGAPDEWRSFAIAFSTLPRAACVVGSRETNAVLVAAAADSGIDAGATLKALLPALGGRGGGSPRLAQGSLPDADAFARTLATLAPTPPADA